MSILFPGQTLTSTDRNGTVHTLAYDVLGRLTTVTVTTLGTNIDGAVRRVETAYDGQGNAYLLTNYDATTSGNIINQVQRAFNGLGQMTTEWQSHSGAVNTSTSPKVQYTYSEMPSGANHSRPVSMTYPNGRVIDFNYGVALDDAIGRLSALKDGATTLESYDYLGLGTVVKRGHAQSGVDLTFIKASGEGNGDAGDQYTGLDRFGRVVDQRWRTSSVEKDRYQYTYDRNGNRTSETNALSSSFNEAYSYDNLNQLTGFNRNSGARTQSWDYDALGNWESVTTDATTQTRTHNRQNEITAVSGATSPVFDAAGNMTTDETGKQYVYDAWNRLVTVKNSGGTTIASYAYDPLTRRVSETASSTTTDLYYSAQWQVVEERVSGNATKSYVWSQVYVDAMVARDRDTDANGSLDERLYVMHDANFNVTGLVNTSGTVVERYTYDPFGAVTVHDGSWSVTTTAYVWQYLHQGGRLSGQSGLYSFRYREYSPTLGRWVTMDPIGLASRQFNLYALHRPLSTVDPYGLCENTFKVNPRIRDLLIEAFKRSKNGTPLGVDKKTLYNYEIPLLFVDNGEYVTGYIGDRGNTILNNDDKDSIGILEFPKPNPYPLRNDNVIGYGHIHPYNGQTPAGGFSAADIALFVATEDGDRQVKQLAPWLVKSGASYVYDGKCIYILTKSDKEKSCNCSEKEMKNRFFDVWTADNINLVKGDNDKYQSLLDRAILSAIAGCNLCYYKVCGDKLESASLQNSK